MTDPNHVMRCGVQPTHTAVTIQFRKSSLTPSQFAKFNSSNSFGSIAGTSRTVRDRGSAPSYVKDSILLTSSTCPFDGIHI